MRSLIIKILVKALLTHIIGIYWNAFDVLYDVADDVTIGQMVISSQIVLSVHLVVTVLCLH
jgi:hypothetical protein